MEKNQRYSGGSLNKVGIEAFIAQTRYIINQYLHYLKLIVRIRQKAKRGEKINVLFILIHGSVWQYEEIYQKFEKDQRYKTTIIVAPYTLYGKSEMHNTLEEALNIFRRKKYVIFSAYDKKKDEYIDVKTKFKPDVVFFTNPHKLTEEKYTIDHFWEESLTCYVPYGIYAANIQDMQFNQQFHNMLWRHFLPSHLHKKMAIKYAYNKGVNTVVTGYPKCDVFIRDERKIIDIWKKTDKRLKRIIWAPHHTIENNNLELGYSTFEMYSESMLKLVSKYKDNVQFALKPHPLLWIKLKQQNGWSDNKVIQYRKLWQNGLSSQLEEGDYLGLFIHSDGMILDSISFISEYLYLNKPHLFLAKDENTENKFNEYGQLVYEHIYKASNIAEIERFIEEVIIRGKDSLSSGRNRFTQEHLIPSKRQLSSEMVYNHITKVIQ